jgi:hypothetical protein
MAQEGKARAVETRCWTVSCDLLFNVWVEWFYMSAWK